MNNLSLPVIITPTAVVTVCVVIFGTHHPLSFFFVMVGFILANLGYALMKSPSIEREISKITNKEKKEDKALDSTENSNQDSTTENQ